MAGFGGTTTNTFGGRAGSFNKRTKPAANSMPGSFGGPAMGAPQAGPQQQQQAGPQITSAGPGTTMGGGGFPFQRGVPQAQQISIKPPPVPQVRDISVSAERNKDLDQQLQDQRNYVKELKEGTGFASDVLSLNMADSAEGARNAAKYQGGAGGAGQRQARQNQITDSTTRANASAQAQMLLGREGMIGNFMNQQMNPIVAQQQGMLGQQGLGLQAEGLRQNYQGQLFGQGLAGQQMQMDVARFNRESGNQAYGNQLAGNQQMMDWLRYMQA